MGLFDSAAGYFGQQQTNAMNWDMMVAQQQFEAYMSNTAHQREMADFKAAGLNPILSAGGSGATTPQVAAPAMVSPLSAAASGLRDVGIPQVLETLKGLKNLGIMDAQEKNIRASTKLTEANATNAGLTAKEKGPWADMSADLKAAYGVLHDKVSSWLNRAGINRTNASEVNWFFGAPPKKTYDFVPAPGAGR